LYQKNSLQAVLGRGGLFVSARESPRTKLQPYMRFGSAWETGSVFSPLIAATDAFALNAAV